MFIVFLKFKCTGYPVFLFAKSGNLVGKGQERGEKLDGRKAGKKKKASLELLNSEFFQ